MLTDYRTIILAGYTDLLWWGGIIYPRGSNVYTPKSRTLWFDRTQVRLRGMARYFHATGACSMECMLNGMEPYCLIDSKSVTPTNSC